MLCVGLGCIIAGGGIFFARRGTANAEKKTKPLPTYRLSAFTEIDARHELTLCAARGFAAAAPENTVASVRAAGDEGFTHVLLDVAMTRDEVPVLLADDSLRRMTADERLLRAVDFDTLRQIPLDNGAAIEKQTADVYIPSLSQALDMCARYGMTPLLTVRTMRGIDELRAVLRAYGKPYLMASSDREILDAFRDLPCERLYRTGALSRQAVQIAQRSGCGILFDASQTTMSQIRGADGIPLWAETVRSRSLMGKLADNGIRNIVTDVILPIRQ